MPFPWCCLALESAYFEFRCTFAVLTNISPLVLTCGMLWHMIHLFTLVYKICSSHKYLVFALYTFQFLYWLCCSCTQIFEKNPTTIKNFGIWLRYQSRTGYHNMYKEYRDTTLNGGVEQMYTEMASRHRVRHHCIQIIKTATVPAKLCKRESTKQFHNSKIKFPLMVRKVRPPSRKLKTTFKATRPNLFV